jgi:hypothetical protein
MINSDEMSLAQMQVSTEEAIESYNRVLKRKPVDVLLVAIASNNLIAIRGQRPF